MTKKSNANNVSSDNEELPWIEIQTILNINDNSEFRYNVLSKPIIKNRNQDTTKKIRRMSIKKIK